MTRHANDTLDPIKKVIGNPVKGLLIQFEWTDAWVPIFDRQIDLVLGDVARARIEDKVIVYLSCPLSPRGGGYAGTNVEIAKFVENRLQDRFGERFWVLNPARYQLESKEGKGLIDLHAKNAGWSAAKLEQLKQASPPGGGDYMRMWATVLASNEAGGDGPPLGDRFDMYYFLGPQDVSDYFAQGTAENLTASIESYFARKLAFDPDFVAQFGGLAIDQPDWEKKRKDFFRFYAVKASVNFSLGSHDEWNIFRLLNQNRRALVGGQKTGDQLGGFFDGRQIDPAATETAVSAGYAIRAD